MERDELLRALDRIGWRLDALDQWRAEVDKRVAVLESEIVTEREARHLRDALARQGQLRLSTLQKWAAVIVGAAAIANLVRGFFPS